MPDASRPQAAQPPQTLLVGKRRTCTGSWAPRPAPRRSSAAASSARSDRVVSGATPGGLRPGWGATPPIAPTLAPSETGSQNRAADLPPGDPRSTAERGPCGAAPAVRRGRGAVAGGSDGRVRPHGRPGGPAGRARPALGYRLRGAARARHVAVG